MTASVTATTKYPDAVRGPKNCGRFLDGRRRRLQSPTIGVAVAVDGDATRSRSKSPAIADERPGSGQFGPIGAGI